MSDNSSVFNYEQIQAALRVIDSEITPSELHGLMAGWLCVNAEDDTSWTSSLFPDMDISAQVKDLFEFTAAQLKSDQFEFQLLLAPEEASLSERGGALADWAYGFLTGLGLTGLDLTKYKDIQESLQDLTEISKLAYEGLTDTEENEEAYTEVSEFVRMAALLIYMEINTRNSQPDDAEPTLH